MASWTQIANKSLRRLGSDRIADIADATESARAIADVYEQARDDVLAEHPWKCARFRTSLAADATAPAWGYAYAYTMPADPFCLRPWSLEELRIVHQVEGRKILTDEPAPLKLIFIGRVTDPELFSPWVANTIAARIAWDVAYRLTQSSKREDTMAAAYAAALATARSIDSQQGTPDPIEADELVNSRY